jgi:hypothetical protein
LRYIERKSGAPRIERIALSSNGFIVEIAAAGPGMPSLQTYAWNDVRRAVASKVPEWVGSDECVLIECKTQVIQLTPEVAGYDALLAAAPQVCPGWVHASEWRTRLMALSEGAAHLELFQQRAS